jgi:glycosyltransferase involved in cell wall biosynthesis
MRIAQVMAGSPAGGAELFFERLTIALSGAGETVLPVIRRNAARAQLLSSVGLDVVQLGFGGPLDLLTRRRLRAALRSFAPRVVVAWMNRAARFAPRGDWVLTGRLGGYYDLRYYRHCDHLIGNTRGIVEWLRQQGWAESRTHYLPNFVDDFSTASAADLPGLGKKLLALGRLHTDKGFDTLIRALPRVLGATLAIAGIGPEETRLRALARNERVADRVHFLGWRHDAGALLRAVDLFVCSSRIEPLGNMVIEAWSAGCPTVAVAAAGPAELIHDGQDGLLVPHENPTALAEAINALLDDQARAQALAAAGRRRFETEFSRAVVLTKWRDFLAAVEKQARLD